MWCICINILECPAGTFGLNCSSTCGDNYYGRLFNCTDGQYCDPVHGCLKNHRDTTKREPSVNKTKAGIYVAKLLFITGDCSTLLVIISSKVKSIIVMNSICPV